MKIKLVGINARYSHSCLALFYLRHELERNLPGTALEICQFTINDPYYALVQRLAEAPADCYFFSSLIWNSELVEDLIADLLIIDESSSIIVGGPQAAVIGATFADAPRVTVFSGEIEAAGPGFYADLRAGTLRPSYHASFLGSGCRSLPYPYRPEDFSTHLRNRAVYYESSRGCPFFCTYCLSSVEKGVFHKDLEQVYAELEDILAHAPPTVRFVDRTFNDDPRRALAIWRFLEERAGDTLFHFEIAPDRFTVEMLDFLATVRAGLFQFEIGIQSTNPDTLAAIRRRMDPVAAAANVRRLRGGENIHLHVDLILGLPYETRESFHGAVNDIFAMEPHYVQMGLLKLLPATAIKDDVERFGLRASVRPPYGVFATRWLDGSTLRELYWLGECIERFVNNRYFPSLWRYLVDHGEDMAVFFQGLTGRLHEQGYFWLAATQETLCRLIIEETGPRPDFPLVRELICYDWLRCGHRSLPEPLRCHPASLDEVRREVYHQLPQTLPPYFDRQSRKQFLKKSVFHWFSAAAARELGFAEPPVPVLFCFLNEREASVLRLHKVLLLQMTD